MSPFDGSARRAAPAAKQPPHSVEAEQSVLGALLLNNRAWLELADQLAAEDFYSRDHRVIFEGIAALLNADRPCDFVTLTEALRQAGRLEDAGGYAYVAGLAADTPGAANVRAYAGIVRERSVLRALIAAGQDIAELGYQPDGRKAAELMDAGEALLAAIRHRSARSRGEGESLAVLVEGFERRLDALRDNPQAFAGVPSGFTELDRMTQGMHEGDLVIVGGRPGMGKTSFAMNIAEHVAIERALPTLVFSMEMSKEQLAQRVIASCGRIELSALRSGALRDEDWSRLVPLSALLRERPLFIDDAGALSISELGARARRMKARHGIGLIVVDYIQLMRAPHSRDNRTNEISEISRSLKALAKELKLPVIALSQLSRSLETRTDKRPQLSDLRESGSIEQDADVVLFVYRDDYHNKDSTVPGTAEVIVAKQRSGPTGRIRTAFLGRYARFDNLAPEYAMADAAAPAPVHVRGFRSAPRPHWNDS